jgi:hypothetical protein
MAEARLLRGRFARKRAVGGKGARAPDDNNNSQGKR